MKFKKWYSNQKLEYWKDIEGYEGLYMISSLGRVKSLERKDSIGRVVKEKILKPQLNNEGYLRVTLFKKGKAKMFLVHRLIAIAFIPNPLNKETVNHKDENPSNNLLTNLEWMTNYENCRYGSHDKRVGEALKGEKNPRARKVKCVETNQIFNTLKEASEWCGLKSSASITRQIQGKSKYAGTHSETGEKLTWMYIEEEINLDLNIISMTNIVMIEIYKKLS